jgi:preprotein translocase subunit SecD
MLTRARVGGAGCDVEIQLAPDDADRFETISTQALGRQLALVLDGEVLSAPTVNSVIEGGGVCISGGFDPGDTQRIVERLIAP